MRVGADADCSVPNARSPACQCGLRGPAAAVARLPRPRAHRDPFRRRLGGGLRATFGRQDLGRTGIHIASPASQYDSRMTGSAGTMQISPGSRPAHPPLRLRLSRSTAVIAATLSACVVAISLATFPVATEPTSGRLSHQGVLSRQAPGLPVDLASAASSMIGASNRSFWSARHGHFLVTDGGGIRGSFSSEGVAALRASRGTLGLSLASVGSSGRLSPVFGAVRTQIANEILFRYRPISEYYRNGPYGLEQGFTVLQGPTGRRRIACAWAED